ncbi:Transcription factor spt8 [Lecanora helva]
MDSFVGDDDDRESAASLDGSSENEQDGRVDERDDEDGDANGDAEAEAGDENGDENEDEEEEQDQVESQYSGQKLAGASQASLQSNSSESMQMPNGPAPTSHPNPSTLLTSPSPTQESIVSNVPSIEFPKPRPEVLAASVYDIVPTIAAPHSTSINSITATTDLRWVFTGGADGYIRKFNWLETANGKSMLTVAQRHPFVDSVTKAGVLMSYWENNEESSGRPSEDNSSISSVYSLAVQREGLWLLSGLESGGINLQSVRVDEGKRIARLQGHTSAVSVFNLSHDERSVLSGSWDKTVIDWDLNSGKTIRKFEGSGGQISALETRPSSSLPVPEASGDVVPIKETFMTDSDIKPRVNGSITNGIDHEPDLEPLFGEQAVNGDAGSPADSLFGGNDGDSLFGDNENEAEAPSGGDFVDEDDEFSRAIADGMREQAAEPVQEQEKADVDAEGDVVMDGVDDQARAASEKRGGEGPKSEGLTTQLSTTEQGPAEEAPLSQADPAGGLPHDNELSMENEDHNHKDTNAVVGTGDPSSTSQSTFLAASIDGSLRVWDKRQPQAIAKIHPQNAPPWCMNATWSPDGNFIYAGRRNGTVDEYSLHKGLRGAERSFKLPNNSGPVSALRAMPNGRHLIW